jgi:16S rRNA processing protein RimM
LSQFIAIALIVKARGIRGEVSAEILTDFPERFSSTTSVRVALPDVQYQEVIQSARFHKGRVLLKFRGRERPEQVRELIGGEIQIPLEERMPLPEGAFYESDLLGLRVEQKGRNLGVVAELFRTGAEGVNLVIRDRNHRELMIPLARAFVRDVDLDRGVIQVDLPPGLAPSS